METPPECTLCGSRAPALTVLPSIFAMERAMDWGSTAQEPGPAQKFFSHQWFGDYLQPAELHLGFEK